MGTPLHVLILEDRPADAELVAHELRQAGFDVEWQRVDAEADFRAGLEPPPDVILADYSLPMWDAPSALRALQERGLDIPFIMMSGTVGEDLAVECMKQGAVDYFLKDRMARLGPAVTKALEDKRLRDERRLAETALRESEERHRLLFENASLGIGYFTPQGQIIAYNKAAAAQMGGEPGDYAGKTLIELHGEADGGKYLARIKLAIESDVNQNYEDYVPLPTGDKWFLSTYSRIINTSGDVAGVQIISDNITERKQAEEALHKVNRAYRTISDCNQVLVRAPSESALLQDICRMIVEAGGYRMAWVGFAEQDETRRVRPMAYAGHEAGYLDTVKITWDDSELGRGPTGTAIRTGEIVAARRIVTDPDYKPWRAEALKRGYTSSISLPLVIEDQAIGALNIYAAEPDAFDHEEINLLAELTGDLAFGIEALRMRGEREHTQEALAQERNLLRTLIDNIPDFIYVKDVEGRFIIKNEADAKNLGVQSVEEVAGKTDFDYYPQEMAERFRADDQQVMQSGQPLINREEPNTDSEGNLRWFLTTKVPLRDKQGEVIGLVGIGRDITKRKQAEEAEHEQRVMAEALAETASTLNNTLDQNEVMALVLENVGRVVPHEAADIQIIDQEGFSQIIAYQGYEMVGLNQEEILKIRFPLETFPPLPKMCETRQPIIIPETQEFPGWADISESRWVRSYLGAPILVKEKIIGFISLGSTTSNFFTPAHADKLQAFAHQAAIAIQNAQLYQELEDHSTNLAERVEERTQELRHTKERVESILNSSPDAILLLHDDGTINTANPAFQSLFGYRVEDVFDKNVILVSEPGQTEMWNKMLMAVLGQNDVRRFETVALRQNGTTFTADVALAPIVPGEVTTGIVCTIRDITEHKRAQEGLREALERERELRELKSRFISMVSHEFRNPLASIQLSASTLEIYFDRLDGQKRHQKLAGITEQTRRMTELLEDVLTVGRLDESGKINFKPERADLSQFCEDVFDEIKTSLGQNHNLVFEHPHQEIYTRFDHKLMRQVLGNLLSNAIKYSPEGSAIRLTLAAHQQAITLSVADNGIGIPEADQKHLFETFHRASNVGAVPGTGLGLAIVKQAIEAHNGTITYESQEGIGTTIFVTLPLVLSE